VTRAMHAAHAHAGGHPSRALHSSTLWPRKLQRLHAGRRRFSVLFRHSFLLGRMNPLRARNTSLACAALHGAVLHPRAERRHWVVGARREDGLSGPPP
jgi:hypothetical protein